MLIKGKLFPLVIGRRRGACLQKHDTSNLRFLLLLFFFVCFVRFCVSVFGTFFYDVASVRRNGIPPTIADIYISALSC